MAVTSSCKLCTFCNASTNGYEKRLFTEPQPKGPYFPILAEVRAGAPILDELGRAVVCLACFHHLLRQWSSFERRNVPLQKRSYNLITDDRVNNYQHRREDEIRREAAQNLKDIQHREEKIRKEAEEKLKTYEEREKQIKLEAERRLCEEQRQVDEVRKEAGKKLREEQLKEERIRNQLELRLIEEKEKGEYIRKEAERLLREEKLLDRNVGQQPTVHITRFRTEVIVPEPSKGKINENRHLAASAPELRGAKSDLREESVPSKDQDHYPDMDSSKAESSLRSQRKKKMEYDPETGCYVKVAAEDAPSSLDNSDKERVRSNGNGSAGKKDAPSRVSESGDSSAKSRKTTDNFKVSSKKVALSAISSRRDSVERKRKEAERQRAQSGAMSKPRSKSEPNLDTKLKEMEQRRARMFLHGKGEGAKGSTKKADESKVSTKADKSKTSLKGEDSKISEDARKNKKRTREERNRRRISAEEINLRKAIGEAGLSPPEKEAREGDNEHEAISPTPTERETTGPGSPSTKPDEKAVKIEYVWTGKAVTRVEVPIGKSTKEQEEELTKVGQPIKGYLKKDLDDVEMSDEEPMELKVQSAQEKSVECDDPDRMSNIREELLNLESATTGTADGRTRDGETKDSHPTLVEPLHDEPESKKRMAEPESSRLEPATSVDLPTFGQPGDSVDGPSQSLDDFVAVTLGEFRKRADSTEGETHPRVEKLIQIETTIEVNNSAEVQSTPDTESQSFASPVIESISSARGVYSRNDGAETVDEERRRKRKEQEEKRRRIEEKQQRAAMEKKSREGGLESSKDAATVVKREKTNSDSSWDAAEKRSSLRGLWETLAGPPSPTRLSNDEIGDEQIQIVMETEVRGAPNTEEFQLSPREEENERELQEESSKMDIEETRRTASYNGVDNAKHKLSEEELKWECAGHFEPGKLRSKFHQMAKDAPVVEKPQDKTNQQRSSRYDWMKNEALDDQELLVPHKLTVNLEVNQTAAIDDRKIQDQAVESLSKPWEVKVDQLNHQNETFGESESVLDSSSEDERRPRIETDEYHKLSQAELKWEGAGQFQPSKLNKSLFTEFDRPSLAGEERQKFTKMNKLQETGVPSKLDRDENRPTLVVQSEYEQNDRPSVGRLQTSRDFEDEDEFSEADMKRRHFEEERRRIEREEIEREKAEERRRRERDEQEESLEKEDFPDDEFELKVKTKAVNKIDRTLLGQFLQGDRKEEDVTRRRKPQQAKPTVEESVMVIETVEVVETEPIESNPYDDEREHNGILVKETDLVEDEFERKVLKKNIGKINLKSSPFHGALEEVSYSSQRNNTEEDKRTASVSFDVEESVPVAEILQVIESEPVQYSPSDELSSDGVSPSKDLGDDPFERKVQGKKIGKINLESSPFLNGNTTVEALHDIRPKRWEESRRNEEDEDEEEEDSGRFVLEHTLSERARETSPVANENVFEDDEFELKVKMKEVKKLNLAQFEFKQRELEEKEERLRQLEEERRKKEREEKEKLKKEEERRRLKLEAEARARAEEDERIRQETNVEVTIEDSEPKSVGKLDIAKLSQFQRETIPPPKPPRTYDVDVSQPSQESVIESVTVSETRSTPDFEALENGYEEVDYEDKRKDVGRLSKDWYFRQQQQEAEEARRKAKYLEEERLRLEREEIERSRQEERCNAGEEVSHVLEQDSTSSDKPSNVGKLNLDKFSQFRQSNSPARNAQKQRVDLDRTPETEPREVVVASNIVEVESSPYEVDLQEDEPSIPDKPKSVGRLGDSHVAMFNRSDPETNPRPLTPDTSGRGSNKAQQVKPPARSVTQVHEVTLLSAPPDEEEEEDDYEQRLKNVKKLDVDRFMQSRKDESIERQRRKKQLEEERLRREKEEMDERRVEERRRKQEIDLDRVDGPQSTQETEVVANERFVVTSKSSDEKPVQINGEAEQVEHLKSVGRLSFDQFSQFQQTEAAKEKAKKPRQEVRRREERPRRYVIESKDEVQPHTDINHNITYTHSTSRTPKDPGERDKPKTDYESETVSDAPEEKLAPKRLSRDMFAAFQNSGSNRDQPAPMRRAKSELQLTSKNVTIVDQQACRDDDAVLESRRRKNSREQKKRARPKSIAFIDTSMFEN